ncbi:MAG: Coenzyme F420 hydrogenase/dehydrogenase, beta subunit C-terminal domain [Lachnospiraceae bacterium]|nr:Coenzyme F420 hydrogenase/dehydrogenase, beta subunit C-terminal domain [Lachnospiraceae bacterium]
MPEKIYQKKSECCGCETCANACPKGIIVMEADAEGFFYPKVTDPDECINCYRCEKVCPFKNASEVPNFQERAIAGYSLSQDEIKASASGGLGTSIAKGFIKQGGVVFGVTYTDDCLGIEYRRAERAEDLEQFRTSKYAQSRKNDVYQKVRADLDAGKKVLFVGLPCDSYALQLFLGKQYENLYVCTLICHGPTSLLVHQQYLQGLIDKHGDCVESFSVRYKKDGWKPYYIRAKFSDGYEHLEKFAESVYGVAFLYMKRPSCNVCPIKRSKIHSDITIGDYHLAAGGKLKPYNPDGVSSAFVHTEKGDYLVSIADNFLVEEIPVKNALYSEAYHKAIQAKANRAKFGRTIAEKGLTAAASLRSIKVIDRMDEMKRALRRGGAKVKKLILGRK